MSRSATSLPRVPRVNATGPGPGGPGYSGPVSKARNWLREERRKVLGDWVAVCLGCGSALRYFEESEGQLPTECTQCGGEIRSRCPACAARFSSAFAVDCEACGAALRPNEQFGVPIRRP